MLRERRAIDPDSKKMWRSAGTAGALGIEIALCIVIGAGGGYLLDRKFNTHWIMYLGLLFGIGAAIKGILRVTQAYKRESAAEDDKARQAQSGQGQAQGKEDEQGGTGGRSN
jgi:F0F1-type ATP synthase assembly protein I